LPDSLIVILFALPFLLYVGIAWGAKSAAPALSRAVRWAGVVGMAVLATLGDFLGEDGAYVTLALALIAALPAEALAAAFAVGAPDSETAMGAGLLALLGLLSWVLCIVLYNLMSHRAALHPNTLQMLFWCTLDANLLSGTGAGLGAYLASGEAR